MKTSSQDWAQAFRAFLDRRALIMLFLGFSAGVPILLIFSSLSLWLGEAGVDKSAVTFFSWAALGYSFKFVWAPLIDELPVPILTKILGRRRAWLLIAQLLITASIVVMASSDPSLGNSYLIQMAVGAVLLGFSAATQDIVIDAYRIELGDTQMQTVLASTYNAGYRIGMIVAGAGALFLAGWLGTSKGNYIYNAWKYTYLIMACVMVVGVITTLCIREPNVARKNKNYHAMDYLRLVFVFFVAVSAFVISYIYFGQISEYLEKVWLVQDGALLFLFEMIRFIVAIFCAVFIGTCLVKFGAVEKKMAIDIWISPVQDFFQRYGIKLALFLLLLIGFYRISDIIAGVISNVFYQDLNFTKAQIAEAVKVYGVIFSLLGGFLGGLLAQRFNIMKLMFIGAVFASATNLMFIGLVKSGEPLSPVSISLGEKQFTAQPDDVGYWHVDIPVQDFNDLNKVLIQSSYSTQPQEYVRTEVPFLSSDNQKKLELIPFNHQNTLSLDTLSKEVVIRGQYASFEVPLREKDAVLVYVGEKAFPAKIEASGKFSAVIESKLLLSQNDYKIEARIYSKNDQELATTVLNYKVADHLTTALDIDVKPLDFIHNNKHESIRLEGKVIKSYSSTWLYFAIMIDNLASGLAGAAFIAFLSSLTSVSFTAVQYAIFSSLMTLTPKILGGYSGTIVTHIGYPKFFLMTALLGIPILILVLWVAKLLKAHNETTITHKG